MFMYSSSKFKELFKRCTTFKLEVTPTEISATLEQVYGTVESLHCLRFHAIVFKAHHPLRLAGYGQKKLCLGAGLLVVFDELTV